MLYCLSVEAETGWKWTSADSQRTKASLHRLSGAMQRTEARRQCSSMISQNKGLRSQSGVAAS